MARLPTLDADGARGSTREAARGRVLRYVVTATPRGVSRAADGRAGDSSPIGALQGTRNLVAFTTRRYRNEPLVVSGPGAGRRGDGRRHPERHLVAGERLVFRN